MKVLPYIACALLGGVLDFLVYGVGEIVWPVVYLPLFLAGASILYTRLLRSRWERQRRWAIGAFLAGIVICRVAFVNHRHDASYVMSVTEGATITLRSPGAARTLLVSSEKLRARLAANAGAREVPVVVNVVTDYGCISKFDVSTIDGVDVLTDPLASWTWRTDANANGSAGAGREDQVLPWCRFRWYRTT